MRICSFFCILLHELNFVIVKLQEIARTAGDRLQRYLKTKLIYYSINEDLAWPQEALFNELILQHNALFIF